MRSRDGPEILNDLGADHPPVVIGADLSAVPADRRGDRPGPAGGTAQAERNGGRLDPPLVAVLDEAANICRIQRLPQLYSFAGSQGIQLMTILQIADHQLCGSPPCSDQGP